MSTNAPDKNIANIGPKWPQALRKPAPVPANSEGSKSNSKAKKRGLMNWSKNPTLIIRIIAHVKLSALAKKIVDNKILDIPIKSNGFLLPVKVTSDKYPPRGRARSPTMGYKLAKSPALTTLKP